MDEAPDLHFLCSTSGLAKPCTDVYSAQLTKLFIALPGLSNPADGASRVNEAYLDEYSSPEGRPFRPAHPPGAPDADGHVDNVRCGARPSLRSPGLFFTF